MLRNIRHGWIGCQQHRQGTEYTGHRKKNADAFAFTTLHRDVLPEVATLRSMAADCDRDAPSAIWFPLVRVPQDHRDLGASGWKPVYKVVPRAGAPAVEVLGSHLVIVEPALLRFNFLCRVFDLAYRTRNRSINQRRRVLVRGLMRDRRQDPRNRVAS